MRVPALLFLGLLAAGCSGGANRASAAEESSTAGGTGAVAGTTNATVTVDPTTRVASVGQGFTGLSYEKSHLNTGFFARTNASLIGLFTLLGPSVLRIGGNTVDKTTWASTGTGNTPGVVGPPDVDALAGFLHSTGWKVIYGVNMAAGDSSSAAAEAAYVARALGDSLYGFEIGNEVDLYHSNGYRPTTWAYADFLAEWRTFHAAMHAAAPNAAFTGPATASHYAAYTVPFARDAASDINLLTQHYYRANGELPTSTLDELLQPDPALVSELDALRAASVNGARPLDYRLAEANSFYNGGAPGISDGYGTALWVIDFLFANALHGSSGVNFHGGGDGPGYTPIADKGGAVVEVRPDYYGMLFFALAGQGDLLATTTSVADVNFGAYALRATDGSTSVVLVNKDATTTVRAKVELGQASWLSLLTLLTGPALSATSGYTLGGAPVGPDGTWSPTFPTIVPVTGAALLVDVPPASAALLQVIP
jgi:hypothetical protein